MPRTGTPAERFPHMRAPVIQALRSNLALMLGSTVAIVSGVVLGAVFRPTASAALPPPSPSLQLPGAARTSAPAPGDPSTSDPPAAPQQVLYVRDSDGQWVTPDERQTLVAQAPQGAAVDDADQTLAPAAVPAWRVNGRTAEIPPPVVVDGFTP